MTSHKLIAVPEHRQSESGNVIFFILLAIALIGLVTAAIRSGGTEGANIDSETLLIKATEIKQYAQELERGVTYIIQNGASEEDIRFAHPDANAEYGDINTNTQFQVFHRNGGGARFRTADNKVQVAPANWEFYGNTHAPYIGSNATPAADLIAVLPNVTAGFCRQINKLNGFDLATQPADTGAGNNCVKAGDTMRFDDGTQYATAPNTMDASTFLDSQTGNEKQAPQACVKCDDGTFNFYHVLYAR